MSVVPPTCNPKALGTNKQENMRAQTSIDNNQQQKVLCQFVLCPHGPKI